MNTSMQTVKPEFPYTITQEQFNRLHKTNKNALIHILSAIKRDTRNYLKSMEK